MKIVIIQARIALLVPDLTWIPCMVEISHDQSPHIRNNGPHEYAVRRDALAVPPDIRAQFMSPNDLFARYLAEDIEGAEDYIRDLTERRGRIGKYLKIWQ